MFGFEYDKQEEREALLEAGYQRGRIKVARELIARGIVTLEALKSSEYYSEDELVAIAKPDSIDCSDI
ncbi:hypothetical protein [Anaerovibrio slackiae]|uniref:hypothetical protein n=1 Tax=Anaerovibrio slackiae TaxID=2652309 RepID=UPI00386DF2C8|nr:hypothetical protein [Selenomonadaceae bacterium]